MATQQHICFYSNKCKWSHAFLTELAAVPFKSEFRFICVDPSPNRAPLPSWLKKVPTLVIRGESEPRTDGEVMNWLYERKMKDTGGRGGGGGGGSGPGGGDSVNEPEPFTGIEMGAGGSDMYAFLDMTEDELSVQGNGGSRIQHSYAFLNGGAAPGTRQGSQITMTDHNSKRSKKEELLDKQMEQYMRARDASGPKMIARQ
jgi:hypothetical protein